MLVCFTYHSHARLWVHWAPGIPHALCFAGRTVLAKPRAPRAARMRSRILQLDAVIAYKRATRSAVIARLDRAIQYSREGCDGIERPRRTGYPTGACHR